MGGRVEVMVVIDAVAPGAGPDVAGEELLEGLGRGLALFGDRPAVEDQGQIGRLGNTVQLDGLGGGLGHCSLLRAPAVGQASSACQPLETVSTAAWFPCSGWSAWRMSPTAAGAMGESRRMIAAFISAPKPKMTAAI